MKNNGYRVPVLLLVFNRPGKLKKLLDVLRMIKPERLYVNCDFPRRGNDYDQEKVKECKELIEKYLWECDLFKKYNTENKGCKRSCSEGIKWFFSNEDSGIVLEDDCLPSLTFFRYCEEMLPRFKEDPQVEVISGDGRPTNKVNINNEIVKIDYPNFWGWASYSSAWENYQADTKFSPKVIWSLLTLNKKLNEKIFWLITYLRLCFKRIDTWDYQFVLKMLINNKKSICPKRNLIRNIGFDENATHTSDLSIIKDHSLPQNETEINYFKEPLNEEDSKIANENIAKLDFIFYKGKRL